MLVLILQSWEKLLTEVVAVLVNEEAGKVLSCLYLIDQEVYEALELSLLLRRERRVVSESFLKIFGALLGEYLSYGLLRIREVLHELKNVVMVKIGIGRLGEEVL